MFTFVDNFAKSIVENVFRLKQSSITGGIIIWIISALLKLAIIALILAVLALLIDTLYVRKKEKRKQREMQLENFFPEDYKRMATKCSNCGASVPLQIKGQLTMSCPFCSGPLELSKTIIDQAIEARKQKEANEIRMKELEDKRREQELEKEQLALEKAQHTKKIFLAIVAAIGTIAWIVILVTSQR